MGIKELVKDLNDNHPLLKAKTFYFLFDAAVKTLPRHLGMYYKHTLLLSPHQVAVLLSIRPFILIFGSPFLGSIADKTNKFRHVILISLMTLLLTYVLVPLVEPVEGFNCKEHINHNHTAKKVNFTNPLHKQVESNKDRMQVRIHRYYQSIEQEGNTRLYNGNLMRDIYYTWPFDMYEYERTDDITEKLFTIILLITIIGEFFASPAETFADIYTLRVLESNRRVYGLQILPGMFGFFIVSVIFAVVSNIRLRLKDDFCHVGHIINYSSYLFVVYGLVIFCIILAATFKFKVYPKKTSENSTCCKCNFLTALPVLAESPEYTAYAVAVIFCGFGCGIKQLYINHYITELGGPHQLLFVVLSIHFISGFVALLLSPHLLDLFGHRNIIAASLLCNGFSFVVYSVIKNPWLVLIAEPVQGICDQLSWVAIVTYAGAPPNIGAALQGTVHGLHKGLGIALGYYAVCILILKFGYVSFFLGTGLVFFFAFGVFLAVIKIYPQEQTIAECYNYDYSSLVQSDDSDESDVKETTLGDRTLKNNYDNETLDKSFLE